jgi:hypothetical protein
MAMSNPYMMGMMNPYMMMVMPPQTAEQFGNKQRLMTDLQMKQIDFMGKINPFLSTSRDTRMDMSKSLFDFQAGFSDAYNPYASGNLDRTKRMMNTMSDYQMNIMMNPFAMGLGYPVMC